MPTTMTGARHSVADILTATRPQLGPEWMAFPAGDGRTGSLRSHFGHVVTFDGVAGRTLFATALLPNGGRAPYAGMAKNVTTEAFAATLTEMIRGTLAPLHDSVSPARLTVEEVFKAVGGRARGATWRHGTAHIHWMLRSGGRARVEVRSPNGVAQHAQLRAMLTISDPSAEEAAAVLRAIDTTNADLRQHEPVHGDLATLLKAAGPGLRPVATYDRPPLGGRLTSILTVDDLVTVELGYRNTGPDAWVGQIGVYGSLRNVLAAARSV